MLTPADIIWWISEGSRNRPGLSTSPLPPYPLVGTLDCRTGFLWRPPACRSTLAVHSSSAQDLVEPGRFKFRPSAVRQAPFRFE